MVTLKNLFISRNTRSKLLKLAINKKSTINPLKNKTIIEKKNHLLPELNNCKALKNKAKIK